MSYWLMKSEPDVFGIDDLAAAPGRTTCWDGVRNYQARNFMRDEMKTGDGVLFYHSNCAEPGIVGLAEVVKEAYPDHTAFDPRDPHYDPDSDPKHPRWYMVDIRLDRKLKRLISLDELKRHADGELRGFALLKRGNRLSVLPVSEKQWNFILSLE
ncbi:MAG TPA: EVE domain-containing protein [Gammaproteobacteria bacterium]|nr:EVE domain-containing protein [Gammaproteobacteria bacterium]